jgi:hypothetical protein
MLLVIDDKTQVSHNCIGVHHLIGPSCETVDERYSIVWLGILQSRCANITWPRGNDVAAQSTVSGTKIPTQQYSPIVAPIRTREGARKQVQRYSEREATAEFRIRLREDFPRPRHRCLCHGASIIGRTRDNLALPWVV